MLRVFRAKYFWLSAGLAATFVGCAKEPAPAPPVAVEEEVVVEEINAAADSSAEVTDAMSALGESDRAAA